MMKWILVFMALGILDTSCCSDKSGKESQNIYTGEIERLSKKIDGIIPTNARIEVLAEGFTWSEGPLWLNDQQMLIFTDVPNNIIYSYTDEDSLKVYLQPSGLTIDSPESGNSGGNGLLLDKNGNLIICQHGDRRVAKMIAPLNKPEPNFETLADSYDGKRFNSPNDAIYDKKGNLYFTDPPYGLNDQDTDKNKEMPFNGVYRLSSSGEVILLTAELTRPNGIALSPDETTLYVANSDPKKCLWMKYDIAEDGSLTNGKVLFNATSLYNGKNGLADGMKVDNAGNVFATGPGGVLVFSPKGKHLGTIKTGHATANCGFNKDKSVLYMTAHNYLMRVNLKANGSD